MSLIFEDIKDGIAYKKYFNKMLDKFGVDSPEDLDDDKKKEFFNAVDKGWVADHEESTDLEEGTLSKKWQKGDKSVKSGDFELVRGKQGVHTIKKNGEAFGDFSLDTDVDMWVANIKGQRGQVTVDDIDKLISQLSESVEISESVLDEGVSSEAKSVMREINKHLKILKTELKTSDVNQDWKARLNRIEGIIGKVKWTVEESLDEAKGSDCTIQNDGRNNIAVCIDGLSFADARKGTRGAMMNIDGFKKKAKVAWADAKGKPTIPAVKKEIKALKAKNFYAKWQADSSSYKDDSVKIWFTK